MNRPVQVKPDNFFLLLFNALRQRRVPLALRIASHSLLLVALALVIYAWVMGMQFKQAMQQQADALGQSLTVQTAASATELLVSNDILSLNVLLSNLAKNPLVAHACDQYWRIDEGAEQERVVQRFEKVTAVFDPAIDPELYFDVMLRIFEVQRFRREGKRVAGA